MWESIKQNISVVVSFIALLTGGLAGSIATMIFNHYRRDKFWLGCYVKSRLIIKPKHPGISILYNNQQIDRLDLQEIVLKNVGNKVIENLSVKIEVAGEIVEKKLEAPEGATFLLEATPDNPKLLNLTCDYLNQKDTITVQITEADSTGADAKVITRAKSLTVKQLETSTQDTLAWFMGFFVLILISALIVSLMPKRDIAVLADEKNSPIVIVAFSLGIAAVLAFAAFALKVFIDKKEK